MVGAVERRDDKRRVAIFGDVQGHLLAFQRGLAELGVDIDACRLPEDLVVIQVGDLVHKGPLSNEVVDFVDEMLGANPGRWIQLVGNHDAVYLGGQPFWRPELSPASAATLQRWLSARQLRLAAAISTEVHGELLVTHAGMTYQLWKSDLNLAPSAAAIAADLNGWLYKDPERAFQAGTMLGCPSTKAGVVWAAAGEELYRSWAAAELLGVEAPFGQVHGHTSAYHWAKRSWQPSTPMQVTLRGKVDEEARHVFVELAGMPFFGIDPGAGRTAPRVIAPLTVNGHVLSPSLETR